MSAIITVVNLIFLFSFSYWLSRKGPFLKKLFWTALFLKLIAGISVGIIYTYYYKEADTLLFFDDGVSLANIARTDFK